jgi:hypothetical protein
MQVVVVVVHTNHREQLRVLAALAAVEQGVLAQD